MCFEVDSSDALFGEKGLRGGRVGIWNIGATLYVPADIAKALRDQFVGIWCRRYLR